MKRDRMKGIVAVAVVALLSGLAVGTLAAKKAPAGKVVIKGCAKKKPPVTFDHLAHVKLAKNKCATCHHAVKGKPAVEHDCAKCHMEKQGSKLGTCQDMSKTKNPLHVLCITCHKSSGKAKAPTKCAQCHKK